MPSHLQRQCGADFSLGSCLDRLRQCRPLVVCITNAVTVNDCANALLAVGASPVMTNSYEDARDLIAAADALYLNIGTVTTESAELMLRVSGLANTRGIPVLLDPVGAGASSLRTGTAQTLLASGNVGFLRGNISEIRALAGKISSIRGVDAGDREDSHDVFEANTALLGALAKKYSIVVGTSGPIDRIVSIDRRALVENGDALLPRICGTGCILSALSAAFIAASPNSTFEAFVAAFALCGLASERARALLGQSCGPAAMRGAFLDALFFVTGADLDQGARESVKERMESE